ncbi:hypothetical protein [Denitromonas iodatirespirans]|uniref:Aconitase A/isopropylmalate dehydratase small subunit swivel domain-containing protein n=1 Tax=Denitromonas iodatirespirans TaxID=2795389 RepID=A0A944HBE0_DENI1|nr:hypothetical protein [Denitromonas iodatirespirans]MBT0961567.1 hypothetical protein [Denitromonas iodatirespirans]
MFNTLLMGTSGQLRFLGSLLSFRLLAGVAQRANAYAKGKPGVVTAAGDPLVIGSPRQFNRMAREQRAAWFVPFETDMRFAIPPRRARIPGATMKRNATQKLIADHCLDGRMSPGEEITLRIDQTLTQDATCMLAMGAELGATATVFPSDNGVRRCLAGQGSSGEHAAIAPRFLGWRALPAKRFARIHRQNLINVGIRPLGFDDPADFEPIERDDILAPHRLDEALTQDGPPVVH